MFSKDSIIMKAGILLKKNFFIVFIMELMFIVLNASYLIFLKKMLFAYLTNMQSLMPEIKGIQEIVDTAARNAQAEQLIASISPSVQNALFLIFILTPIILLSLWILFQGMIWKRFHSKKIPAFSYFRQCACATIIMALLGIIVVNISWKPLVIILLFILYYILTVVYNHTEPLTFKNFYKTMIMPALSHVHRIVPYVALLAITSIGLLFFIVIALLSSTINEWIVSPALFVTYGVIIIILNLFLKAVVSLKIHQK